MKSLLTVLMVIAAIGLQVMNGHSAPWYAAETSPGAKVGDPDQSRIVPVAGGNIPVRDLGSLDEGRVAGPPRTASGSEQIIMLESTIGFAATSRSAYGTPGQAAADLKAEADALILAAAPYKTINDPNVEVGTGSNAWRIYFPGVTDDKTGQPWQPNGTTPQNYFPDKLLEAETLYRAAIHSDPYNAQLYKGLLLTFHERMVPLVFAGNQEMVWATRIRFQGSISQEVTVLKSRAYQRFREAAQIFIQMTGTQSWPVMGLLDASIHGTFGQNGSLVADPAGRGPVIKDSIEAIFDTFCRAVSRQADARLTSTRLEYLSGYSDPNDPGYDPSPVDALVGELGDTILPDFENQLLVGATFSRILSNVYQSNSPQFSELGLARSQVELLRQFRDSMVRRELAFLAASSQSSVSGNTTSLNPDQIDQAFYAVYGANFVPFIYRGPSQVGGTVEELSNTANTFIQRAKNRDDLADAQREEFDSNLALLDQRLDEVARSYISELQRLCGTVTRQDGQNGSIPAIQYAFLPPEDYQALPVKPPGSTVTSSEIYLQWGVINQAITDLNAARLDLENLYNKMLVAQQTAAAISGRYNETANLVLQNGERVAALDLQLGEIQAQLALTVDRINQESRKKSFWGRVGGAIAKIGAAALTVAFPPAGASVIALSAGLGATVVDGISTVIDNSAQGSAGAKIASAQADAARKSAAIEAQKTKIRAAESARLQLDSAFINDTKAAEALHAMMLDAERQKLNILMAEQRLDQENAKLDALYARVGFLLEQYRGAIASIVSTNPVAQPDYRLIRDLKIADAENAFVSAQEQAFLVSRAAKYKVNHSGRTADIRNLERNILRARTGQQLEDSMLNIQSSVQNWYLSVGAPGTRRKTLSLRHYILQNNSLAYKVGSGGVEEIDVEQSIFEPKAGLSANATAAEIKAASDAAWAQFLQSAYNGQVFKISFSTHLDEDNNSDPTSLRINDLFEPIGYNMIISKGANLGVGINIRARGVTGISTSTPVTYQLDQKGASYIRASPSYIPNSSSPGSYIRNLDPKSLRVWNVLPLSGTLNGSGTASLNGIGGVPAAQFFERSPANNKWELTIFRAGTGNTNLLNQLTKIEDIEIVFDTELFFQSN
ncbi:MAG: hypothetical protein Fur0032_11730 [Terrimicrobiaceae bacterium]